MNELFFMKVGEAYQKSLTSELADELWAFKNPDEPVDVNNAEYISWRNSLPQFLECANDANLNELLVIFEMKTPVSNKAIDVLLAGQSADGENRVLLVELKQWSYISTRYVRNFGKVYVPEAGSNRRHPIKQLQLYRNNLEHHHSGIERARRDGKVINLGVIAYLHNFSNPNVLYTGPYEHWRDFGEKIFGKNDKQRLTYVLSQWFDNKYNAELLNILKDYNAIMGDEGLTGLRRAYHNEASLTMQNDQQDIVNFVIDRLKCQLENPQKEMIVISGGPGTGKTIVGIRFILEYVNIFNNGINDNKVIFSLPKSQTVKAVFDDACSVAEENENEYCCYLQEISTEQNLVVVDEAHRITDLENTLNKVYDEKKAKLLILLQDDHQLLRPGEQGTFDAFKAYAEARNITFSPIDDSGKKLLTLKDEKRCEEGLFQGITKLFYDESLVVNDPIQCVKVFDSLSDLVIWKNENSVTEKTKYIFPFCWPWTSRNRNNVQDIIIGDFRRTWNPEDTDEQVVWLNDNKDDRVACIYTSQGLDMDNVAFVWWDDLIWDEQNNKWKSDPTKLKDPAFKCRINPANGLWTQTEWDRDNHRENFKARGYQLSQDEMDLLIKNTYYVMLSRPRKKLGIWFKDAATKKHVMEILGVKAFGGSAEDVNSSVDNNQGADQPRNVNNNASIIGNSSIRNYHKPNCQYAPRNPNKRVEFASVQAAKDAGYVPCRTCNPDME